MLEGAASPGPFESLHPKSMIKASSLQPTGTRPQTSAPVRKNVVPSRPFWPGRDASQGHDTPAGTAAAAAGVHQLSSNHSYGIHSRQKQLLIHLPTDYRRGVGICLVNRQGLVFSAK